MSFRGMQEKMRSVRLMPQTAKLANKSGEKMRPYLRRTEAEK